MFGYSFAAPDQGFSIGLLKAAKPAQRILIGDLEPEKVCTLLIEVCPEIKPLLEPLKLSF